MNKAILIVSIGYCHQIVAYCATNDINITVQENKDFPDSSCIFEDTVHRFVIREHKIPSSYCLIMDEVEYPPPDFLPYSGTIKSPHPVCSVRYTYSTTFQV